MRKYDEVQELVKRLRKRRETEVMEDGYIRVEYEDEDALAAADEIEELTVLLEKQQQIIRRVYLEHFPNTWYPTSGYGEKDSNGLPQFIEVVPAYGVGWSQVYEKTDRTIQYEGS